MGFKNKIVENTHLILCPQEIDEIAIKQFSLTKSLWVKKAVTTHILDFSETTSCNQKFYRVLIEFVTELEEQNKKIHSIHLSESLKGNFGQGGLLKKMHYHQNPKEIFPFLA